MVTASEILSSQSHHHHHRGARPSRSTNQGQQRQQPQQRATPSQSQTGSASISSKVSSTSTSPSSFYALRRLERLLIAMLVFLSASSFWLVHHHVETTSSRIRSFDQFLVGVPQPPILEEQEPYTSFLGNSRSNNDEKSRILSHTPPTFHNSNTTTTTASSSLPSSYLWSSNPNIPQWMKEYMDWHVSVVTHTELDESNWDQYQYLILRCYFADERCGGVSDRLKPLPLVVLAAQRSQRILFIHWERPFPLEEFLVPPTHGFSWTIPDVILKHLPKGQRHVINRASELLPSLQSSKSTYQHPRQIHNQRFLFTHLHDFQGGSTQYNAVLGPGSFEHVSHDLFRIFFQPSAGVQNLINAKLQQHPSSSDSDKVGGGRLQWGEFTVAHYRAEYGKEIHRHPILREPTFLKKVALNAIRCASELSPITTTTTSSNETTNQTHYGQFRKIYFASDNPLALSTARYLARTIPYPIITFDREEAIPRHLDDVGSGGETNTTISTTTTRHRRPQDYFSTFVDLYIAGNGQCVAYGRGGFGRYASLLSFNASCQVKHVQQFFPVNCQGRFPLNVSNDIVLSWNET